MAVRRSVLAVAFTVVQTSASALSGERRLKIVNGCSNQVMWIAHMAANRVGPDPQDVKLRPGASYDFLTTEGSGGLAAVRYWPKLGCDAEGGNCTIGDSGGPGESCVIRAPGKPDDYSHCAPPTDTKIEATFAAPSSSGRDFIDMSLVDGYSLSFKLSVQGSCTWKQSNFTSMDCSGLSLQECPSGEMLDGQSRTLKAVNPKTGEVAGCYSPCMRLVDDKWSKPVGSPDSPNVAPYCCAGAYASPQACTPGPVAHTKYLASVHTSCPQAYGYPFDDQRGTITCSSTTQYTLTYLCPATAEQEVLV